MISAQCPQIVKSSSFFWVSRQMLFSALANLSIAFLRCDSPSPSPLFTRNLDVRASQFSHFFSPVVFGATSLHARQTRHSQSIAPFLLSNWYEFHGQTYTNSNPFAPDWDPYGPANYFLLDNCVFREITSKPCIDIRASTSTFEVRCCLFSDCGSVTNIYVKSAIFDRCFVTNKNKPLTSSAFTLSSIRGSQFMYNSITGGQTQPASAVSLDKSASGWRLSNMTGLSSSDIACFQVLSTESNLLVQMMTFESNSATTKAITQATETTSFADCNFVNLQGFLFTGTPNVRSCFFSGSPKIKDCEETPMGWSQPLKVHACVFVEPLSDLVGVESDNSQFGAGKSATKISIQMYDNYNCVPKATSFIPSPSRSPERTVLTPVPEIPTPSPSGSPHPTHTPKATTNVPLLLKALIPVAVLLIILPIILYFCIRWIQDRLSDAELDVGVPLDFVSEGSSETQNRNTAMWLDDDDDIGNGDDRSDFFRDDPRWNIADEFMGVDRRHTFDSSSSF